jgi:glycosyltransferase involved in cell wall biosynthesis
MAGFDAFVLPSKYEAFPYVYLEALARGLPIVTTNVGGAGAVVDEGKNGYIVPQENLRLLMTHLGSVLGSSELRASMREHSLQKSRQFTVEHMAKQTIDVYKKILTD